MIFWICAVEMPSAAARSLTVTPERTVAGPVGAGTSSRRSVRCSPRPRRPRWRVSRCGREAAVSMTTRRRPPSCGPRCGRATREPPGGLAPAPAPLPPAGGRPPPAAGRCPSGRAAPDAAAAGRAEPAAGAGVFAAAGAAAGVAAAGRAARLERPPPSARAAAASSTVSPCRRTPASARRRATSPGSSPRSRAMSATRFLGIWKGTVSGCPCAPRRALDGLPKPVGDRHARAKRTCEQALARDERRRARLRRADVGAASPGRPTASPPLSRRAAARARAAGAGWRNRSTCA